MVVLENPGRVQGGGGGVECGYVNEGEGSEYFRGCGGGPWFEALAKCSTEEDRILWDDADSVLAAADGG